MFLIIFQSHLIHLNSIFDLLFYMLIVIMQFAQIFHRTITINPYFKTNPHICQQNYFLKDNQYLIKQ